MSPNVSPSKPSAGRAGTPKTAVNNKIEATIIENYTCRVAYAVFLGLSVMFYGFLLIYISDISIFAMDYHPILCLLGYHFFCGMGILAFNVFNGWSNELNFNHRKIVHACLNVLGLALGIAGTLVILTKQSLETLHGIFGLITMLSAILAGMMGPCAFVANEMRNIKKLIHVIFAVTTFVLAALTIILSFDCQWKGNRRWIVYKTQKIMLRVVVGFYTFAVLIFVFPSCGRSRFYPAL